MSNVQAAIKRNRVVVLLILLAALAVLLAGVRSGGPDGRQRRRLRPGLPGLLAPRRPARRRPARPHDARREDRPDGPDQRRGPPGRAGHAVGPRPAQPRPDGRRSSTRTRSGRSSRAAARGRRSATTARRGPRRSTPSSSSRSTTAGCGIPIIYGADAVHGHNNLVDATMVPHQIGLGATFDPRLAEQLGRTTASAVRATGVRVGLRPRARHRARPALGALLRALRRGPGADRRAWAPRTIRGLQGRDLASPTSVAATAKHFAGYSAPDSGFDRTDATIDDNELQSIHLPSFAQGIDAGVGDRDGQQRLGQRRARPRLAPHAHRRPARPAALQGRRDLRLAGRREPDHQVPRRRPTWRTRSRWPSTPASTCR